MRKSIVLRIILIFSGIFIVGFILMPHMLSSILRQPSVQESTKSQPSKSALKWTSEDGFLTISNVSATAVGGGLLEVYMSINNTRSTEDKLIGCEVHNLTDVDWEISVEGRRSLELEIPALSEIRLDYKTGVFLTIYKRGPTSKLKPLISVGSTVNLTLIFEKAGRIDIKIPVMEWIRD